VSLCLKAATVIWAVPLPLAFASCGGGPVDLREDLLDDLADHD
jgi:hypothetical protein